MLKAVEVIQSIDPARLSYDDWCVVGMVLKDEGEPVETWDQWSQSDTARYKPGVCERKWASFRGGGKTVASLAAMARDQGWSQPADTGRALGWDEVLNQGADQAAREQDAKPHRIIPAEHWLEEEEIVEPTGEEWSPSTEVSKYLTALFELDDFVGYVTESWEEPGSGRRLPKRGSYDRTAGKLLEEIKSCEGDLGRVLGDVDPGVGAWIRFNALDGAGCKDSNVTAFRHALVESDEIPPPRQLAIMRQLELPITALVYSGGKSVHAIVRVDADDMGEYRRRVDFLYEVCGRNGLKLDRQNRNPSRLSRMPGVVRGDRKQFLIDTHTGKETWEEWEEWVTDLHDDLPDIEDLAVTSEPDLAPELIQGVLREGHKLLLSGPSKAHKSFALIQLAIAIAEGAPWWGWPTRQGKVLYVNLELDERSCAHRFWATYKGLGIEYKPGQIDVWNLRGNATSLDKLTPKLIRRASRSRYAAVIIDPIYKVLIGDENSAEHMARFCNEFDRICSQLGAAVIVCHHHSKGAQGHKASQDRASGSGVFARDPDAIVDVIELDIDDHRKKQIANRWECEAISEFLSTQFAPGWESYVPEDSLVVADRLFDWGSAQEACDGDGLREARSGVRRQVENATGWRVEPTLREFAPMAPFTRFFRYTLHLADDHGLLVDAPTKGEDAWGRKGKKETASARKRRKESEKEGRVSDFDDEISELVSDGESPTIEETGQQLGVTARTIRNRLKKSVLYSIRDGRIVQRLGEKEQGT